MDPIALARNIGDWYKGYLATMFYFRDPELRKSFKEALDSGYLHKGPYIEGTSVFKRVRTLHELVQQEEKLEYDHEFLKSLKGERALYTHQEEAILQSLRGRNVVVATGTGSGKTECFLYPVFLQLYEQFLKGELGPGVRALILYPMNALANDQRERLGEIANSFEEYNAQFRFTFGQYIGETPEDENDSRRNARDFIANRLPGELVLRAEIRESPPHILLTNYSMLEYLLLRPYDSPLFDKGRAKWWSFIVLDEAHQYRGSRGIEMAMLVRRLKERLRRGGRQGPFRCIATSATLAEGEKDKPAIASFADDLFGEPFSPEDIILGESEEYTWKPGEYSLSEELYRVILDELRNNPDQNSQTLKKVARQIDVKIRENEGPSITCGRIIGKDKVSSQFIQLITERPYLIDDIADILFSKNNNEEKRLHYLLDLIELVARSRNPESGTPFLLPRYHVFLRSLEGAFVSYVPDKKVFLDRKTKTQEGAAFEVALCRECGQHYLVGMIRNNKLIEAIRDVSHPNFGAFFFLPMENDEPIEDKDKQKRQIFNLCMLCGGIWSHNKGPKCHSCGEEKPLIVERQEKAQEKEDQIPTCISCGYRAADPVREIVHGSDGPHAVIATTLHRSLPEDRRKLLAFADGRQEAAFFAWYLEDSYRDILSRGLLLEAAQNLAPYTNEGLSLREASSGLLELFRQKRLFPPSVGGLELRKKAWLAVYKEFLTEEQRICLEGVALARWSPKLPDWFGAPDALQSEPWNLTEEEANTLVMILLDYMRNEKAVEILTDKGVSVTWSEFELQSGQMRVRIGRPRGVWGVRSWDGKQGRRAQFLVKLLMQKNGISRESASEQAIEALRMIWDRIRECDRRAPSSNDRLLLPVGDARRLNPDWWRLHLATGSDTIYRCDTCVRLQHYSVGDICTRPRCPGRIKACRLEDLEPNHYRKLYEEKLPGLLRVEEHTAQLAKEKAREFQREFRDGKIHVLSCSTTFELGVDLGDLDNIFLRNVPPEIFNYTQRVGRAGRRGRPGFAITYCRRGPHDLYHFSNPERMLSGKTRPPTLTIGNEKIILRHMTAAALSEFFRAHPQRFQNVKSLLEDMTNPKAVAHFKSFLLADQERIEKTLQGMVPKDMLEQLGLQDGNWIDHTAGEKSRFQLAEIEVSGDYMAAEDLEKRSAEEGDYDTAKWARSRVMTVAGEDVLSFLSRKVVIPKYGFPVDVVELDIHRTKQDHLSMGVALQRDLSIAIAEFAPTSKIVANKRVWTCYGIKRVAGKEWEECHYKRCVRHNFFVRWKKGQSSSSETCCDKMIKGKYIVPIFGFVSDRAKPKNPTSRPARVFTTRPYFAGLSVKNPEIISFPPGNETLLNLTPACPGQMVVLCEGKRGSGFYICRKCGAGFRSRKIPHENPFGRKCGGQLEQLSLGQEITTDVVKLAFREGLRVDSDPLWLAYGVAYALVEGAAEVLEVPSTDLSATIEFSGSSTTFPPVVLYDNVPGGAGLVARLEQGDVLLSCLDSAHNRVSGNCGCDETTSCYGCLRTYKNQFAHQNLQRGPVMHFLGRLLSDYRSL